MRGDQRFMRGGGSSYIKSLFILIFSICEYVKLLI